MLQPLRRIFDDDRVPTRTFRFSDFKSTLTSVIGTPGLRALSFACLAFNGMQSVVTAYFVVYLTTIGYTPVAAGFVFSVAVAVAVPGRIVWGWLGSSYVTPAHDDGGARARHGRQASRCSRCAAPAGRRSSSASIACVLSATALSWHGILLAETARAAPEGMRGGVTGGVLSFGQVGALALPLMYSGLLDLTGSYGIGFIVCGVPALLVGIQLLRPARESLVEAGTRKLHDVPELVVVRLHLLRELLGRHVHRVERLRRQIRGDSRIGHRFLELGVEPVDDRLRRAGRRERAHPRGEFVTLHGLPDRRKLGELGDALAPRTPRSAARDSTGCAAGPPISV